MSRAAGGRPGPKAGRGQRCGQAALVLLFQLGEPLRLGERAVMAVGGRYVIWLPTAHGSSPVEIRVRLDFVEVWTAEHCGGVIDRAVLHDWLGDPAGALITDEVTLLGLRDGRVLIKLQGRGTWPLARGVVSALRAAI